MMASLPILKNILMEKIYKVIGRSILTLTTTIASVGCDNYLDLKSANTYATITSIEDVEALLNNTSKLNFLSSSMAEASADDIYIPDHIYDQITSQASKDIYIWEKAEYTNASNPWGKIYETVFITNTCLDALDEIKNQTTETYRWKKARAKALAFRSNAFLQAIWTWGKAYDEQTANSDLGIVLKTNADVNEKSVRASVQESYDQIIQDLKYAIPFLPNIADVPVDPSKAAAYGLLARTFLSMRQYDEAELYADSCLFITDGLLDFNQDIVIPSPNSSVNPFEIFNKEVVFSTVIGVYSFAVSPTYAVVDTALIQSYKEGDLRKISFFRETPNGMVKRGNYSLSSTQFFTGVSTAEMLLVKAECLVRRNKIEKGLQLIKILQLHRFVPEHVPTLDGVDSQEKALELVLDERRKELVLRSLRWIDIKRLNKEGRNIVLKRHVLGKTYTLYPNDDRYALPLPIDIINLSGMEQN